jgi:hypothetical protein
MSIRLPHTIETVSGVAFDYLAPEINVGDVAHGLGHEMRFGRQAKRFYSVAEHSILVAEIVHQTVPELVLPALWHDAHEAYLGDLPTPLKQMLGETWTRLADRIDQAVAAFLGIDEGLLRHPIIKWADKTAMLYEASVLKDGPGWAFTRQLDHTNAERAALEQGLCLDLSPDDATKWFAIAHGLALEGSL